MHWSPAGWDGLPSPMMVIYCTSALAGAFHSFLQHPAVIPVWNKSRLVWYFSRRWDMNFNQDLVLAGTLHWYLLSRQGTNSLQYMLGKVRVDIYSRSLDGVGGPWASPPSLSWCHDRWKCTSINQSWSLKHQVKYCTTAFRIHARSIQFLSSVTYKSSW